jgi:citrate lyase subunit beta / citryl-CoA lyase
MTPLSTDARRLRTLMFVPGDRPERMAKALTLGADALILDLEDSVAIAAKPLARETVASFVAAHRERTTLFVRINPLDGGFAEDDLAAVAAARPWGYVLPKAEGAASLADLDARLRSHGDSDARILPIATETPAAMFRLGEYAGASARLCGITWGAEDLPAALGARGARGPDGRFTAPYEIARAMTLFAAGAAGVAPIETVFPAIRDLQGLAAYAARAAFDGFTGMMALHPDQLPVIAAAFTPDAAAVAHARAVVAAFDAQPGAGVVMLEGKMVDLPHLKAARRVLERAGEG